MVTMRRSVRGTVAAMAVTLALVAGWAQPAAAFPLPQVLPQVIVGDSFEVPALWTANHDSLGEAYVRTNSPSAARSGQSAGFLSQTGTQNWASLERLFSTPAAKTCSASIWLWAISTTFNHIKFNVEVIDPTSFTYVALRPVEYNSNIPSGYASYTTPAWYSPVTRLLLFRVSLFGPAGPFADAALLDDLSIVCI